MTDIPRRDFLKAVPVAASGLAIANRRARAEAPLSVTLAASEQADYLEKS